MNAITIIQQPAVKVRGLAFVLELELSDPAVVGQYELKIVSHDRSEALVAVDVQTSLHGKLTLSVPIQAIHIPSLAKAYLLVAGDSLDISPVFLRYQLNKNKLNDNAYLTHTIFNASARDFSPDDLFVVTYAYLKSIPLENQNFGGLITVLSYRIADKLDERGDLLDNVYATYRQYREVVQTHDAIAFRWFVSCSSALATVLLSVGSIAQASNVVETALKTIVHPGFNPMVHQNFTLLLFQGGLIKVWNQRFDEATSLFISAVNAGRYGMIDLLHPQNNWLLGQISDCHHLLGYIEAAYCAAMACSKDQLPPQSRFASGKSPAKLKIDFRNIFERFECCKKHTPPFFEQVLQTMQTYKDQP
ncbi:hypothetical protein [Methylovulum psychrotolerans]|uniref:Uncharacterized protein n=1 Tax=Methylovulum psychrotolerans TaxID=1704499 RepID=A0A1Z4BWU7_9GAMM|nr:hypothetical protein [Methylovulum psychrotolerans]ASF45755.1 hypothetical protein CEK71_06535 [Methylovulum psychrotolerans]MBT9099609.1 hypothetical protein [Methylovulum psychrotolerans]POZ50227.1 hypothetical protein AADEFJLK_03976 [Methylovulum psychrotolerans]